MNDVCKQLMEHKIDLEWVNIGVWVSIKGKQVAIVGRTVLVRYKEVLDGEDIIEIGIKRILGEV